MSRQLTREDILNCESVHLYTEDVIYVELEEDEVFGFNKGGAEWYKKGNFYDYFESSIMMSYFTSITKEQAADMVEEWIELFKVKEKTINKVENDILDCFYSLYLSDSRSLVVSLSNRQLTFSGNDYGKECEIINGKKEYEFSYSLDEENTYALLVMLRNKCGIRYKVETVLKKEFGYADGSVRFEQFCMDNNIIYKFFSF